METENVEIIKAMVGAGLGVTVIPKAAIAREARARRFGVIPLKGRPLWRETGWVSLKSDDPPRPVRAMLELFQSMRRQLDRTLESAHP
jgi:DNA-binding transcriptional LysR family regulator